MKRKNEQEASSLNELKTFIMKSMQWAIISTFIYHLAIMLSYANVESIAISIFFCTFSIPFWFRFISFPFFFSLLIHFSSFPLFLFSCFAFCFWFDAGKCYQRYSIMFSCLSFETQRGLLFFFYFQNINFILCFQ